MSTANSHRSSFATSLQSAAISLATTIFCSSPFKIIFEISTNPSSWKAFPLDKPNCSCMHPARHFSVRVCGGTSLTKPSTSSSLAPSCFLHSAASPRSISFASSMSSVL
uniref:Uncharacterized protein n=1 Tax=Anopheles atroparvus TaxID=41427 RepID=A0A182J3M0_ANOAO